MKDPDELLADFRNNPGDDAAFGACVNCARSLDAAGRKYFAEQVGGVIALREPKNVGRLGLLAGAIIEVGGAPEDFPPAVFDVLAAMLAELPEHEPNPDEPTELPDAYYLL